MQDDKEGIGQMAEEIKILKLMACPFCGGIAEMKLYGYKVSGWRTYAVCCRKCAAATTTYPTKRQAAYYWNRRDGK